MADLGALILPKLVDLMFPNRHLWAAMFGTLLDGSPEVAKTGSLQGCLVNCYHFWQIRLEVTKNGNFQAAYKLPELGPIHTLKTAVISTLIL